jgi:hypothetical protein
VILPDTSCKRNEWSETGAERAQRRCLGPLLGLLNPAPLCATRHRVSSRRDLEENVGRLGNLGCNLPLKQGKHARHGGGVGKWFPLASGASSISPVYSMPMLFGGD